MLKPEYVGLSISETACIKTTWEGRNHLALHPPITIKNTSAGSLFLYYELILRLAIINSPALLVFYLLFAYFLFTVYPKNRRILNHAYLDELTGLPNSGNYHASLQELRCQHLALAVLNPQNYGLINILYGYGHGDNVLIQIARHLREISMQKPNLQPFRLSDDRFLLVIRDEASLHGLLGICRELPYTKEEAKLIRPMEESFIAYIVHLANKKQMPLARLEALPVDFLKLDRPFVEKLHTSSEHGFVSDIISLAHHIDKLVIAEGVGTRAQEGEPQKLGCDYMQGCLYSRLLAAEQAFLPMASAQDDDE